MSTSAHQRAALKAALRKDLSSFYRKAYGAVTGSEFSHNWHIDLLADKLVQCFERKIKRLIICVPPRSGKSLLASVAFPAWAMGQNPSLRFLTVSYAQKLSSDLCRQQMSVMQQPWYRELFPGAALNPNKRTEEEFETLAGGCRFATSALGTLTGRGGDFIILDDIIKPLDALSPTMRQKINEWVEHTLLSRLNDKINGVIIVIMQRVHHDDFVAHLMDKGGWELVSLPAIAVEDEAFTLSDGKTVGRQAGEALHPAREPLELLRQLEKDMTPFVFSTQYQQMPIQPGGNIIRTEWFGRYDHLPPLQDCTIYQSWDTAFKDGAANDYSACITWLHHEGHYYILDVYRAKLGYPQLKEAVLAQRKKWTGYCPLPPSVLMEDAAAGISLIQDLKRQSVPVKAVPVKGSKEQRAYECSLLIHGGHIHLPVEATWLKELLIETEAFPNGRHDDQVDALSLFLNWHRHRPRVSSGTVLI
ncbi:MAG: terminase [Pseudomonas fluorescens]|nr:MAG: terminase [Pseudomonas fluorescens]